MPTYTVIVVKECQNELLFLNKIINDFCLNIEIIGFANSIDTGLQLIMNLKPDIVFFDVKFENSIIFDHLEKFDLSDFQLIFVSAEKEYAVNAFQVNALDFIMKPLNPENIVLSINKSIKKIKRNVFFAGNEFSTKILKNSGRDFDFIVVTSLDKIDVIKTDEIMYCTSDGKYTTFFLVNGKNIVSSKNLGSYEKLLEGIYFYRIHHSYIVNIKHLTSIRKKNGNYCELQHNILLPIAKRRQENFYKLLNI